MADERCESIENPEDEPLYAVYDVAWGAARRRLTEHEIDWRYGVERDTLAHAMHIDGVLKTVSADGKQIVIVPEAVMAAKTGSSENLSSWKIDFALEWAKVRKEVRRGLRCAYLSQVQSLDTSEQQKDTSMPQQEKSASAATTL